MQTYKIKYYKVIYYSFKLIINKNQTMDQSRISNLSINSHQSGSIFTLYKFTYYNLLIDSQNIERIISLAGKLNSIQVLLR